MKYAELNTYKYFFILLLRKKTNKQKTPKKPQTLLPPLQDSFLKANQKIVKNIYKRLQIERQSHYISF